MVLGSNRGQHRVSGRAVYAQRTNGNCSVITRVGGGGEVGVGWGWRYDAAQSSNEAGRLSGWEADVTQGRSYSLSIRLTSLTRTSV